MKKNHIEIAIVIVLVIVTVVNAKIAFNSAHDLWNGIAEFSTVIIALGALITAVYSSHLQKLHNYKTTGPFLHYNYNSDEQEKVMKITILNDGKGPAIIKKYILSDRKTNTVFERNRDFHSFAKNRLGIDVIPGATLLSEKSLIKSEGSIDLVKIDFKEQSELTLEKVKEFVLCLKIDLEFTDVYERKFDPEPLQSEKCRP